MVAVALTGCGVEGDCSMAHTAQADQPAVACPGRAQPTQAATASAVQHTAAATAAMDAGAGAASCMQADGGLHANHAAASRVLDYTHLECKDSAQLITWFAEYVAAVHSIF